MRWREVMEGVVGAAVMAAAGLTPFLRERRCRWGLPPSAGCTPLPGDELVPRPRWQWTHGIAVSAASEQVWPWVAQIGADRAGFYSYAWLENLVGCGVTNADRVHPEWQVQPGGSLSLHPDLPAFPVVHHEPGRCFVVHLGPEPGTDLDADSWVSVSWLFLVQPLGPDRCRVISRYRASTSDDLATRLQFGPVLVEPVGFAMDRRMLIGIRDRAEGRSRI